MLCETLSDLDLGDNLVAPPGGARIIKEGNWRPLVVYLDIIQTNPVRVASELIYKYMYLYLEAKIHQP